MKRNNNGTTQRMKVQETLNWIPAGMISKKLEQECKCSYPSCHDKAWRDHFCWDHYQHEYYTGR